jgi:flagellin-like protein
MKKVYKKREEDAVSPVIATILMVAITVVLAAVLYVMVIGMGGGAGESAPVGTMSNMQATSRWNATLTFGQFAPIPAPMDIRVRLTDGTTGDIITLSFPNQPTADQTTLTATGLVDPAWGTASAVYTDLNYAGNAVNSGDAIKVIGLTPGRTYTISIYHVPTDSLCSMTGSLTFQTPA